MKQKNTDDGTYSPCKTMISSIRTFLLFLALIRAAERGRLLDVISEGGGVGLSFSAEDLLPAEMVMKIVTTNKV